MRGRCLGGGREEAAMAVLEKGMKGSSGTRRSLPARCKKEAAWSAVARWLRWMRRVAGRPRRRLSEEGEDMAVSVPRWNGT